MTYHTNIATMTDEQIKQTFDAAWAMLENDQDYTPQLTHTMLYNYWNAERGCCEAWITDGNPNMHEAVKHELVCSWKPQSK